MPHTQSHQFEGMTCISEFSKHKYPQSPVLIQHKVIKPAILVALAQVCVTPRTHVSPIVSFQSKRFKLKERYHRRQQGGCAEKHKTLLKMKSPPLLRGHLCNLK